MKNNEDYKDLVLRVEPIADPREFLEYLEGYKCNIRLFLKKGDKNRHGSKFPLNKERMLRVYAEIHHDSLSSIGEPMITKKRKEGGVSVTFVNIAPVYKNQKLTFFVPLRDLSGKSIVDNSRISHFGFDREGGSLAFGNRLSYNFYTSRDFLNKQEKKCFDTLGKSFNLSDFGWEY